MRFVEFVPFRLTEMADIFSIRIDGRDNTKLENKGTDISKEIYNLTIQID